jgi:hypothetical protein
MEAAEGERMTKAFTDAQRAAHATDDILPGEEWRPIPGYDGRYDASNIGRIRSWASQVFGDNRRRLKPRLMKPRVSSKYLRLSIAKDKDASPQIMAVHRLVLMAFVGLPTPAAPFCRHLNGDRFDNRLENLRWGTLRENTDDTKAHGTWPTGSRNPNAKLTDEKVRHIRARIASGWSYQTTANAFGISKAVVSHIISRRSWAHVA